MFLVLSSMERIIIDQMFSGFSSQPDTAKSSQKLKPSPQRISVLPSLRSKASPEQPAIELNFTGLKENANVRVPKPATIKSGLHNTVSLSSLSSANKQLHTGMVGQSIEASNPKMKFDLSKLSSYHKRQQLGLDDKVDEKVQDNLTKQLHGPRLQNPVSLTKQSLPKRKNQLHNLTRLKATPQTDNSSEDEYDVDATPGPGQYEVTLPGKQQIRSKKESIRKIFYSSSKRFKDPSPDINSSEVVEEQHSQSPRGNRGKGFFLSKLPKFHEPARQNTPPPGYYNTRQGLEHELVRNILKSSNSSSFINCCQKNLKLQQNDNPGPGSYQVWGLESDTSQSHYMFRSNISRNLNHNALSYFSAKNPQEQTYVMHPFKQTSMIHVKTDSILQDDQLCPRPPFLSSSQRFPAEHIRESRSPQPKITKSPTKQLPSCAPFNSSSKRQLKLAQGDGAGVGLYTSFLDDGWKGKSFNAKCI